MKIFVIQKHLSKWKNNSTRDLLTSLAHKNSWGLPIYLETGKPTLSNGFVSISHSNELLLIAYSTHAIGIDCELIRPLNQALIQKLNLDLNNPILDWCKRESLIKLLDDKQYLLKKELNEFFFEEITLNSKFCVVISSKYKINNYVLIYLDEDLNTIDQTQ